MSPLSENTEPKAPAAEQAVQRASVMALLTNLGLVIGQIAIGVLAHAWSLVADALHTLSDLATDAMVLVASARGARPPDADHPYGHRRLETLASLILGSVLMGVGFGFLWLGARLLTQLEAAPPLGVAALYMACATLLIKEGLFRYLRHVGQKTGSRLLLANAWHARSDAASSLVVALGIGGSLLGYRFLEPLAAALVGFMIIRMGARFAWESASELMDKGLGQAQARDLQHVLEKTPGVKGVHSFRTRKMANQVLCDAHVQVGSRLSVSEGHRIAESARARVLAARPDVLDVLVHVDCEEDDEGRGMPPSEKTRLPDRNTVDCAVRDALGHSGFSSTLHWLGGGLDVEVTVRTNEWPSVFEVKAVEHRLWAALSQVGPVRSCQVCFMLPAPITDEAEKLS